MRWNRYQPILHPLSADLEERILLDRTSCAYAWNAGDLEAKNLVKFLFLDDHPIARERKAVISQIRLLLSLRAVDLDQVLKVLEEHPHLDHFPRAVQEFFAN